MEIVFFKAFIQYSVGYNWLTAISKRPGLALMWIFIAGYLSRHLVVIPFHFDLAVVQNEQVIDIFQNV